MHRKLITLALLTLFAISAGADGEWLDQFGYLAWSSQYIQEHGLSDAEVNLIGVWGRNDDKRLANYIFKVVILPNHAIVLSAAGRFQGFVGLWRVEGEVLSAKPLRFYYLDHVRSFKTSKEWEAALKDCPPEKDEYQELLPLDRMSPPFVFLKGGSGGFNRLPLPACIPEVARQLDAYEPPRMKTVYGDLVHDPMTGIMRRNEELGVDWTIDADTDQRRLLRVFSIVSRS